MEALSDVTAACGFKYPLGKAFMPHTYRFPLCSIHRREERCVFLKPCSPLHASVSLHTAYLLGLPWT